MQVGRHGESGVMMRRASFQQYLPPETLRHLAPVLRHGNRSTVIEISTAIRANGYESPATGSVVTDRFRSAQSG